MQPAIPKRSYRALSEWLDGIAPSEAPLAWCHTTDAWNFQSILQTGTFRPQPCKVFGTDLTYLFYGRPAYRRVVPEIKNTAKAPVVVILHPAVGDKASRMFPFDTGAFVAKRYKACLHPDMQLEHFELTPGMETARRHVAAFFQTNAKYWHCEPAEVPPSPGVELLAEALSSLYRETTSAHADDRRHCIEAQIAQDLAFDSSSVMAVVLPRMQLDSRAVQTFRERDAGIAWVGYDLNRHKSSVEYQVLLEQQVYDLHRTWGWV